jgi:hypothetical protein
MERTNYSRSEAPETDKIAIKFPDNATDPSPTLKRI